MAVTLEFHNIIVRRTAIEQHYPGGWDALLARNKPHLWLCVWHDDHLFREGAMNPFDTKRLCTQWDLSGLLLGIDYCVISHTLQSQTNCDWLEMDDHAAWLAGADRGAVMGRDLGKAALVASTS